MVRLTTDLDSPLGADAVRRARRRSGLTLRQLAARAETSHSAIAAYEAGRKTPTAEVAQRVVEAAGFGLIVGLERRVRMVDGIDRGDELVAALELAAQFPARHARDLDAPVFPAVGVSRTASASQTVGRQ